MASESREIVKRVPHAILYSDGNIMLHDVRVSYPHVLKPWKNPKDDKAQPRFSSVLLLPKTAEYRPAAHMIRDRINEVLVENKNEKMPRKDKFLRDGDDSGKEQHEGYFTVNTAATTDRPPIVRHKARDPKTNKPRILDADRDEAVIQGGYWVNALIRPWYQNNSHGRKINAGLVAIQFNRKDELFGTGRISEDEVDDAFDEFADDNDSGFETEGDEFDDI